jgi:hypothetical protein
MKDDGGDVLNATALFKMPAGRSEMGACCPRSAVADLKNHKESDHKLISFQVQIGDKTSSIVGFREKCALAFLWKSGILQKRLAESLQHCKV